MSFASYFNCFVLIFTVAIITFGNSESLNRTKRAGNGKPRLCRNNFEGFGVHLGAIAHLNKSTDSIIVQVADLLYNDLELRLFRTSYEEDFSPAENEYDISCRNAFSCTWNKMHYAMAKYPDIKIFASIWSPPHYMKNNAFQLKSEYEGSYYFFIKHITSLIKQKFNQTIELVSVVNEPENFAAPWDHTNMTPHQLCGMVGRFNDPFISACTENAWFSSTKIYMRYKMGDINCERACKIVLTHAYRLNIKPHSPNFLLAYYDNVEHQPEYEGKPVWQTEVSSTYADAEKHQMLEAIDLAINIVQFVGTTCVTRYYFWSAFNIQPSGEALIWGNKVTQQLDFPKKYFVFRHFTRAAKRNPNCRVRRCDDLFFDDLCLQFGIGKSPTVFVNRDKNESLELKVHCPELCCTNKFSDHYCDSGNVVPPYSVCSCNVVGGFTKTRNAVRVKNTPPKTGLLQQFSNLFTIIG